MKPATLGEPEPRHGQASVVIDPDDRCDRCGGIATVVASRICGTLVETTGLYASFRGALVLCNRHAYTHSATLVERGWHIRSI